MRSRPQDYRRIRISAGDIWNKQATYTANAKDVFTAENTRLYKSKNEAEMFWLRATRATAFTGNINKTSVLHWALFVQKKSVSNAPVSNAFFNK